MNWVELLSLTSSVIYLHHLMLLRIYRVSTGEVSRSIETLLPELLSKAGDTTPRIHNIATHTILSVAEVPDIR